MMAVLLREAAHRSVSMAKRAGLLTPCPCERCGDAESTTYFHHWSYEPEHWLDVIPLCCKCHRGVHAGRYPEPRTGRILRRTSASLTASARTLYRAERIKWDIRYAERQIEEKTREVNAKLALLTVALNNRDTAVERLTKLQSNMPAAIAMAQAGDDMRAQLRQQSNDLVAALVAAGGVA